MSVENFIAEINAMGYRVNLFQLPSAWQVNATRDRQSWTIEIAPTIGGALALLLARLISRGATLPEPDADDLDFLS